MNKKLLALAVAGAFVAPAAMADSSNVVIGGTMHFSLDSMKGATGSPGSTDNTTNWNVSSNASNIYFKGTEDLGNGLSAIWQIQTYFSGGGTAGSGGFDNSFGGTKDGVSSGNTYVGLSSKSWGMVILGKHESPLKLVGRKVDLFGDQLGDNRNLVTNAVGGGIPATSTAGFDTRPNNVVAYGTPDFNGFKALVAYVTNASGGVARDSGNGADSVSAWAGNVMYENGPIYVGLGYEKHKFSDFGTPGRDDEKAWRLSAGYNFGDFKVVGLYQHESGLFLAAANNNVKRNTWGLGGAYKLGANTLKLQYYKAGDLKNSGLSNESETGASMWALGVDHALSKRTTIYAVYAQTNNDNAAAYSAFGGGHGDNPGTVTGKDPHGFGVGVKHTF